MIHTLHILKDIGATVMRNKDFEKGRDFAIEVLCDMINQVLDGQRMEFDKTKPYCETFERLVAVLDRKIH